MHGKLKNYIKDGRTDQLLSIIILFSDNSIYAPHSRRHFQLRFPI